MAKNVRTTGRLNPKSRNRRKACHSCHFRTNAFYTSRKRNAILVLRHERFLQLTTMSMFIDLHFSVHQQHTKHFLGEEQSSASSQKTLQEEKKSRSCTPCNTFRAVLRSWKYSLLESVWLGAMTIESPVWTPRGSKFWTHTHRPQKRGHNIQPASKLWRVGAAIRRQKDNFFGVFGMAWGCERYIKQSSN